MSNPPARHKLNRRPAAIQSARKKTEAFPPARPNPSFKRTGLRPAA